MPGGEHRVRRAVGRAARDAGVGRETMLWRLLRIGSAPYFVLGNDRAHRRTRPLPDRQPVGLAGPVRAGGVLGDTGRGRTAAGRLDVHLPGPGRRHRSDRPGHVEIRWSHGRFAEPPEAKVYLDTPMARLPGYHPLVAADEPQLTLWPVPVIGPAPWDGDRYQQRFDDLAASGVDVHGEAAFVAAAAPSSVLDAGCGTGRVASELARRGIAVVGVDLDPSMIATARRRAPGIDFEVADVRRRSTSGAPFDLVVMAGNVPSVHAAGYPGRAGRRVRPPPRSRGAPGRRVPTGRTATR